MKNRLFLLLLLVSVLAVSCGDSEKTAQSEIIDPANFTEATHTATQVVLIEETDDFFFGNISTVQPTSKGDILVGDFNAKKFFVFNPGGDLIGEIGKEGSGPGEFQQPGKSYVGHNDTLFVLDWSNARITAFTETTPGNWSHQLDIPVVRGEGGMLNGFFHFGTEGMIGQYSQPFRPGVTAPTEWPTVSRINRNGEKVGEPITNYRPFESKIEMGSNFVRVFGIPYGKRGTVVESQNALHVSNNDIFGATSFSLNGDTLHHFQQNVVQRPVTEDMIFDTFDGDFTSDYYKSVSDVLPQVRPAFDSFQADNDGNVYFSFDDVTEDSNLWLKFSPDGDFLASFTIPTGTTVQRIYNNKIYCSAGADDVPYIIVYEITQN